MILQTGRLANFATGRPVIVLGCTDCNWRAVLESAGYVTEEMITQAVNEIAQQHECWGHEEETNG